MKNDIQVTDKHVIFWGSFLSNFQECSIIYSGKEFKSSEQLFMWFKATYFKDPNTAQLIEAAFIPQVAKRLGREVKNYDDTAWDKVRYSFMKTAVLEKFKQNIELLEKLLDPMFSDKIFVEASPFDRIWGVGVDSTRADNPNNWLGKNLLGKVLNEVREELKN